MATKKAKIEAEWDESVEEKIEKSAEKFANSCCSGDDKCKCGKGMNSNAGGGAVYGLGFIGALVYFIQTSTSFWDGVWGIIQAILWPAFIVFELLKSFAL
ncbi:hypothetical protein HGB13_01670 [bacterium]|nr:hypothetical protein [bacterium]